MDNRNTNEKTKCLNLMDKLIWNYYKYGIGTMALLLMLAHWYGVYDYSLHPRPMVVDTEQNGNCVIWIYCMAYVYMPLMMIPASRFFKQCWLWRVPYIYFFGINGIRLHYGHWLITSEMLDAHFAMIYMTVILYAYGVLAKLLRLVGVLVKNHGRRAL